MDDWTITLTHKRSGKSNTITLSELIDLIQEKDETECEEIQILPIITSQSITLSVRPHLPGTVSMEIDHEGSPVYINIPQMKLHISIRSNYGPQINMISNGNDILIPGSNMNTNRICIDIAYDMGKITIDALFE